MAKPSALVKKKVWLFNISSIMKYSVLFCVTLICWTSMAPALMFQPADVNYNEVEALISFKSLLIDPHEVLDTWDKDNTNPCGWAFVCCSADGFVVSLGVPSQNLSGTLSPGIQKLTKLQILYLHDNSLSGQVPVEIGRLANLLTLDLSNNNFFGHIPSTLSHLHSLQYLRLNNNNFSGTIPAPLANKDQLTFLDLSFNNLSGHVPWQLAKTFIIVGNPLICHGNEENCFQTRPVALSLTFSSNDSQLSTRPKIQKIAIALGTGLGCICLLGSGFVFFFLRLQRHKQQIISNAKAKTEDEDEEEACMGTLKRFKFEELVNATNNFSTKSILGTGGFGNVYKGHLKDGTAVAVKRLKDGNASGGETQFQTELMIISLAVHRNLLQLYGFCTTATERLLVYPFMSNGSLASCLKAKPALAWGTRKRIALGTARGLLYLHEQCDPKIIHRDMKAANVLLDDQYEPVVGDFGLVKLMEHEDSHVTTAVRGTLGYIAPEYFSTGHSSDKTDVFAFGVLLLELVTGRRPSEFGEVATEEKAMVDWVDRLYGEKRFAELTDKGLENVYDQVELNRMIKLSFSCTQYDPNDRPKMSEVVRVLEENKISP